MIRWINRINRICDVVIRQSICSCPDTVTITKPDLCVVYVRKHVCLYCHVSGNACSYRKLAQPMCGYQNEKKKCNKLHSQRHENNQTNPRIGRCWNMNHRRVARCFKSIVYSWGSKLWLNATLTSFDSVLNYYWLPTIAYVWKTLSNNVFSVQMKKDSSFMLFI